MLSKIRSHWWLPISLIGVATLWALGALFGFCHAYVLAGGENPLMLLEGRLPIINGVALGVGLASIGSDLIKATSGFVIVSALMNRSLRWHVRIVAVVVAALLCLPTLFWSARSAVGFAALAFGDTIAGRGNEVAATKSLRDQIAADQGRLGWLNQQTSDKVSVRRANRQEADELRRELKQNRTALQHSKGVGAADPGGAVIATALGISPETVYSGTVILFIIVVELCSILGFPCLALATAVAKPTHAAGAHSETEVAEAKSDKQNGPPSNSNARQENSEPKSARPSLVVSNRFLNAREAIGQALRTTPREADTTDGVEIEPRRHPGRRGRPRLACIGDGHVEKFIDLCQQRGVKPERKGYVDFCRAEYLTPMASAKMWQVVKRYGRVGKRNILRYFDPKRAEINGSALAH